MARDDCGRRRARIVCAASFASLLSSVRFAALLSLVVLAWPAVAVAQSVDGVPVVGRWLALRVVGDEAATADLTFGRLDKVLVVQPGGAVTLRGTDRVMGQGRDAQFTGRLTGSRLRFADLPGTATLRVEGHRLVVRDPRGVETVYLRAPSDG